MSGFAELCRSRAWERVLPALGPRRAAVVGGDDLPSESGGPRPLVVVRVAGEPRGGDVVGALARLPVQSESLTGVLFHGTFPRADDPECAAALREARRVLQPGGAVVVTGRGVAAEAVAAVSELGRAGLATTRRAAILRVEAAASRRTAPVLARFACALEGRRAATAREDEALEWALTARLPGGHEAELPTAREVLSSMFLPARWRPRPRAGAGPDPVASATFP